MNLPDTQLDILISLKSGSKHGYLIIKSIESLHNGTYKPGTGLLYTNLKKLLDSGMVIKTPLPDGADPRQQHYQITQLGLTTLQVELEKKTNYLKNIIQFN